MGRDDEAVLAGPRHPTWGCPDCGRNQNWASRIRCVCGKAAPQSVVQRARSNALKAKKDGNVPGPRDGGGHPRGDWARGPPASQSKLEQQLATLTKKFEQRWQRPSRW